MHGLTGLKRRLWPFDVKEGSIEQEQQHLAEHHDGNLQHRSNVLRSVRKLLNAGMTFQVGYPQVDSWQSPYLPVGRIPILYYNSK